MKTSQLVAFVAAALCLASPSRLVAADQDPVVPVGALTAFPTLVQTGTRPVLTWGITYPATAKDVVTITGPGTLTPKTDLIMEVRVIGASVRATTTNILGLIVSQTWVPTECQFRYGNGSFSRLWYGRQTDVKSSQVVLTKTVEAGKALNFGGRYYWNNSWSSLYTSLNSSRNVVALVNGDTPPTTTPLYQQPSIESFLLPYLDGQGKVKIGPKDVIYLMELTHTNPNDGGFDLQDLVILVTFKNPS
ncbi:MAG: hypothetical protein QM627_01715 [Luteolibacter sp.]